MGNETIVVERHISNLIGRSHPFLAEASDGNWYVVKCSTDSEGPNLLFNECAGSVLYRACGLPVPDWQPVLVTNEFLEKNAEHWHSNYCHSAPLRSGLAFGSRFLGANALKLQEILPRSSFVRITNRADFWLSWLIDICSEHADNRQVIFQVANTRYLKAVFIDHGHAFGGPNGNAKPHFRMSCYMDKRVYAPLDLETREELLSTIKAMNSELLWYQINFIPEEWKTNSGFRAFADCLNRLENVKILEEVIDTLRDALSLREYGGNFKHQASREATTPVLLTGLPETGPPGTLDHRSPCCRARAS